MKNISLQLIVQCLLLIPAVAVGQVRAAEQRPVSHFAVVSARGDSIRVPDPQGRLLLINLWASWCRPCGEELPALDSAAALLDTTRVVPLALTEDASRAAARTFLQQHPLRHYRVGFGNGGLKPALHYTGIPETLLVTSDGRVVRRWLGYSGAEQLRDVQRAVMKELASTPPR